MKAIKGTKPKFLRFNKDCNKPEWVKHIPMPYKPGELVQVHEDQTNHQSRTPQHRFEKNYLRVRRKTADGWTAVYVVGWDALEPITQLKK